MAYSNVNKKGSHFNALPYDGTGSGTTLTGMGFKPDFFWIKNLCPHGVAPRLLSVIFQHIFGKCCLQLSKNSKNHPTAREKNYGDLKIYF